MKAAAFLLLLHSGAATPPADLKPCGEGIVQVMEGGNRLILADGRKLRLAHVLNLAEGHAADAGGIAASTLGRKVTLACESLRSDRHGALVAHVFAGDVWLQARMIAEGQAVPFLRPGERRAIPVLFSLGETARQEERGLWAGDTYRATADTANRLAGRFGRVEGRIHAVGRAGGTLWLNFGEDRSRDFTVSVPARLIARLTGSGMDPAALAGKQVAATGFVDWRGGPHMALTHESQLELLPAEEATDQKETRPGPGIREPSPAQE